MQMGMQISGRNSNYVLIPGWKDGVFMRKGKGNDFINKDISTGARKLVSYTCWSLSLKNVHNHLSLWSGYLLFCWFSPAQKLFCSVQMSQRWNDYFGCISVSHTFKWLLKVSKTHWCQQNWFSVFSCVYKFLWLYFKVPSFLLHHVLCSY